jgi:uncharacterized membrane protein
MAMTGYVLDWLNLVFRWAHVIAGFAWIGASFYFVWLADVLVPPNDPADRRRGIAGELWTMHDRMLLSTRAYPGGPRNATTAPDGLRWLRGDAYTTWISGLALLILIYWTGASTFLIDPSVRALPPALAVAIAVGALLAAWIVYDVLCRVLSERPVLMWSAIAVWLLVLDWTLFHLFAGRAAAIHLGAALGTIMVANVAHVVVPAHRRIAAQLAAGRSPDPIIARRAKMRAMHNTYFALPVLFLMLSNHYPVVYEAKHAWLAVALIGAAGVLVRRFSVLAHGGRYVVALPAGAALALVLAAVVASPWLGSSGARGTRAATGALTAPTVVPAMVPFSVIAPIVRERCAVCHAAKPTEPGYARAPGGVVLDSPEAIRANASRVQQMAVVTHAMPPGNVTRMTDGERATLGAWIASGAKL